MKQDALVTIIMPTYNADSRLLTLAIDSCVAQTYTNWELIIVDDASSNQAPEIIEAYASLDSRVSAIRHETNRKLPAALNTGFRVSRGDFLTWLSDDDLFRPRYID